MKSQKQKVTSYYRNKLYNLKDTQHCKSCTSFAEKRETDIQEMENLKEKLRHTEMENTVLQEKLSEVNSDCVTTKSDGKTYADKLREVIYFCACKNVAMDSLKDVITYTVQKLTNKDIPDFPDNTTCRRLVREMNILSKIQVSQVLSDTSHNTLKYDGTTKAKQHWVEAQVATKDKTYTIGVEKSAAGDADAYTGVIQQKISDIGLTSEAHTGRNTGQDILNNISNTMTDRHIVNHKANRQILELKNANKENWNNFYCSVHPLDTRTAACGKALRLYEQSVGTTSIKSFVLRGQSQAHATILAVAKFFHKEGGGCPAEIREYLEMVDLESGLVEYHVGQRFHILFHNAGAICYLRQAILAFIDKVWGKNNLLVSAIHNDLQTQHILNGCRALGLLRKQITGPWLKYGMEEKPVLDMNDFHAKAVDSLRLWSEDASALMTGEGCLDETVLPENNAVFSSLVQRTGHDDTVKELLQNLCKELLTVCERQLEDQLPGGRYHMPSESLKQEAASCSSNNISGERIFAKLDAAIRRVPNANMDYHEGKICAMANETFEWLDSQNDHFRSQAIETARKLAPHAMVDCRLRAKKVREEKKKELRRKQEEMTKRADKKRVVSENLLHGIVSIGGLWITNEQLEVELKKMKKETQKKSALKTQLKVRKMLLLQKYADPSVFAFSANKRPLSVSQLKANLKKLIESCLPADMNIESRRIQDCLCHPELLENKTISHCWSDENSGNDKWYDEVIGQMIKKNDVVEFAVVYDEEASDGPHYLELDELITDLRNGDLIVVW